MLRLFDWKASLAQQCRRIHIAAAKGAEAFHWVDGISHRHNVVVQALGDDPRALKAAVRGREQLARGLQKALLLEA